jgi:hypothetical protein
VGYYKNAKEHPCLKRDSNTQPHSSVVLAAGRAATSAQMLLRELQMDPMLIIPDTKVCSSTSNKQQRRSVESGRTAEAEYSNRRVRLINQPVSQSVSQSVSHAACLALCSSFPNKQRHNYTLDSTAQTPNARQS